MAEAKVTVSSMGSDIDERVGLLESSTPGQQFDNDIAWCGVNYEVGKKRILYDCYGHVPSGSVCAIIGPSGSGEFCIGFVL